MGCGNCGKNNGSHSPGCKNNGSCSTGSCNKLNVYNWLTDMVLPEDYKPFNIVEVRFKGSKKLFFRNSENLDLFTGDRVIVESDYGYDLGEVSLSGELVKLQLKKYGVDEDNDQMRKILRVANDAELKKFQEFKDKEAKTLERARTIAMKMNLQMKLSDIEFQGDGKKVTFYYTSEGRVDFRELIKRYASEFRARIEMRQVSYREEASRLGGIGTCGRELCCSTWLTDYKVVTMSAARTQNLSINMLKLSGQCGRLKCCLNYELELYTEALSEFPADDIRLRTEAGEASLKKTDILKRTLWYAYEKSFNWIPVSLDRVNEIIAKNQSGVIPAALSDNPLASDIMNKSTEYRDELLEDTDLTRLDKKGKQGKGRNRNPKGRGKTRQFDSRSGGDNKAGNNQDRPQRNDRNRSGNKGKPNKPESGKPPEKTGNAPENKNRSPQGGNRNKGNRNRGRGPKNGGDKKNPGKES